MILPSIHSQMSGFNSFLGLSVTIPFKNGVQAMLKLVVCCWVVSNDLLNGLSQLFQEADYVLSLHHFLPQHLQFLFVLEPDLVLHFGLHCPLRLQGLGRVVGNL